MSSAAFVRPGVPTPVLEGTALGRLSLGRLSLGGRPLGRRALLGGVLGGVAAALTGCVSIPTAGPIERVSVPPRPTDDSVAVVPDPPQAAASPVALVTGFLQAMAYNIGDYAVAREYLASGVRAAWRPASGVQVFADDYFPNTTEGSVVLQAPLVGRIAADGSYRPDADELVFDFGLVQENKEWRIGRPPAGLLVSQFDFTQFYQSFNLYFYEPGSLCLVPDPIFLPGGDQSATSLVQRLLKGPTNWLKTAVVSALPAQTTLNVSAPIDTNGVVEVSLSDAVSGLTEDQRSRVAAQLTWTLQQLSGVVGVRLLMNGSPWSVPQSNAQGVVPIGALEFKSPIPPQLSKTLVGATADGAVRIDDNGRTTPLDGVWGRQKSIRAVALSGDGGALAAVVGPQLLSGPVADTGTDPVALARGSNLLRPQFSRFGELWSIDARPDETPVVWRVVDGKAARVAAPALAQGRVLAFRLAPDGVRMGVLRRQGTSVELGLVLVNRTKAEPVLDSWLTVPLSLPQRDRLSALADLAWLDATTIMVLGATSPGAALGPYTTSQDGSVTQSNGNPDQWLAIELAASPREPEVIAVLRGTNDRVWRYEDDFSWVQIAEGVTTLAFPG